MVTAVHMVDFETVGRLIRSTRGDAAVVIATASATIVFDLVVAVEIGLVLAGMIALHAVARSAEFGLDELDGESIDAQTEHRLLGEHVVAYRLDGALFFGATQRFLLELTEIADVEVVILRCGNLRVLDASGAQALSDLVETLQHREITVLLACLRPEHRRLMNRLGLIETLEDDGRIVPSIADALAWTRRNQQSGFDGPALGGAAGHSNVYRADRAPYRA
jgi:SulP family sulfate permease